MSCLAALNRSEKPVNATIINIKPNELVTPTSEVKFRKKGPKYLEMNQLDKIEIIIVRMFLK
jgi:hypothetical protein